MSSPESFAPVSPMPVAPPRMSLITTCKGRLAHLQQSLPLMVAQSEQCEVIVVDYDCPDGTADWVRSNHPQVKVVRVTDAPVFNPSKARNRGAEVAGGEWLGFVDADILLRRGLAEQLLARISPGKFYRPRLVVPDLFGTFFCSRDDFLEVGGFDEAIVGWGGEDRDIYHRLTEFAGRAVVWFPPGWLSCISHTDAERVRFTGAAQKLLSQRTNLLYRQIKYDLFRLANTVRIPLKLREQLHEKVRREVVRAVDLGLAETSVSVDVSTLTGVVIPEDSSLTRKLRYEFRGPLIESDPTQPAGGPGSMAEASPNLVSSGLEQSSPRDGFRTLKQSPSGSGMTVFAMVRNEAYLLPHFLVHYRRLGVENFVFYDDHSTDGTLDLLAAEAGCTILTSDHGYRDEMPDGRSFQLHAKRRVPESLGAGRWVLTVDADEFLVLPQGFTSLPQLAAHLDSLGHRCVMASMVDFYPARLADRNHAPGMSPFEGSRHFDMDRTFDRSPRSPRPQARFKGVRARMLSMLKERDAGRYLQLTQDRSYKTTSLWKVPLIKTASGVTLESVHEVNIQPPFDIEVALAHFKFGPDLDAKIASALVRRSYFRASIEYEFLKASIDVLEQETLVYPGTAVYRGPESLQAAGFAFAGARLAPELAPPNA